MDEYSEGSIYCGCKTKIRIILYYPHGLGRNTGEILCVVEGMQVSDKYKVAMPVDWPKNAVFKDHVIIHLTGVIDKLI